MGGIVPKNNENNEDTNTTNHNFNNNCDCNVRLTTPSHVSNFMQNVKDIIRLFKNNSYVFFMVIFFFDILLIVYNSRISKILTEIIPIVGIDSDKLQFQALNNDLIFFIIILLNIFVVLNIHRIKYKGKLIMSEILKRIFYVLFSIITGFILALIVDSIVYNYRNSSYLILLISFITIIAYFASYFIFQKLDLKREEEETKKYW